MITIIELLQEAVGDDYDVVLASKHHQEPSFVIDVLPKWTKDYAIPYQAFGDGTITRKWMKNVPADKGKRIPQGIWFRVTVPTLRLGNTDNIYNINDPTFIEQIVSLIKARVI